MGFTTGDDVGAVIGVKLHSEHSLVGTLKTQQHTQTYLFSTITMLNDYFISQVCHMEMSGKLTAKVMHVNKSAL